MKEAGEAHRCTCLMFITEVMKIYVCILTVLIALTIISDNQC